MRLHHHPAGAGERRRRTVRFKCRGPSIDLPDEPADSPVTTGGTLRIFDLGGSAGDDTYALPAANWERIPQNVLNPLRGFRYKTSVSPTDPCKVVLVRDTVVRGVCKNQGVTLTPPFNGDAAVVLTIGGKRYCAQLGGTTLFNQRVLWRRNAPAPGACSSPSGAFLEASASMF